MKRAWWGLLGLAAAGLAQAQDAEFGFSVGLKAWNAHWMTFGYETNANGDQVLTQNETQDKLLVLPTLGLRWGDFIGAVSGFRSSSFSFVDGSDAGKRKEYDVNLGYRILPGFALTLGYKKLQQGGGENVYRPAGPIYGFSGNAVLSGPWTIYGSVGLGRLKTPGGDKISFDADYRQTEVGLAYTLQASGWPRSWSFTAGYRIQSLSSKDAANGQSGIDETFGLTLGVVAAF